MDDTIVDLNVGGTYYSATVTTLTRFKESMLGAMFSGKMETAKDRSGRVFIDRDGILFRYILNYLRSSTLLIPNDFQDYDQLLSEVDFYQIQPLMDELREKLQHERIVRISVGGQLYTTKMGTLLKYPESLFTELFGDGNISKIPRDSTGAYVIDRDGNLFRWILNFLRDGRVAVPSDPRELDQLIRESEYYRLKPLIEYLREEKGWFIEVRESCTTGTVTLTGSYGALDHVPIGMINRETEVSSNHRDTQLTRLQCADLLKRASWVFYGSVSFQQCDNENADEIDSVMCDKWYLPYHP